LSIITCAKGTLLYFNNDRQKLYHEYTRKRENDEKDSKSIEIKFVLSETLVEMLPATSLP
jgi:hypothetical protein